MRIVFDPGKDGINFEKHDGVLLSQRSIAIDMVYILGRDSTVNMRTKSGRRIRLNTPEEDANITAAAEADPDVLPYSDAEMAVLEPRMGRPKSINRKRSTTIRFDEDILEAFKATGPGWQTRMNAALKEWLASHSG